MEKLEYLWSARLKHSTNLRLLRLLTHESDEVCEGVVTGVVRAVLRGVVVLGGARGLLVVAGECQRHGGQHWRRGGEVLLSHGSALWTY